MQADDTCLALSDAIREILGSDGRARDVALYRVCQDVCETLAWFYGRPTPVPAVPDAFRGISAESLRQQVLAAPAIGYSFGIFRNAVLEYEGTCARRLEVLRSTARTLLRLRDQAHDPAKLDRMLDAVGSFVHGVWGLDLDLSADRAWSLRVSRRYDLLPPPWREL
jgi:hypothetical protein